jgi:enamine deaminase RidA (YjgF/YER057c/UK114 family)
MEVARRRVIRVEGMEHKNPIPAAVRIGSMVYSSAIMGTDPQNGLIPDSLEAEVSNVFHHVSEIMREAGGSIDNIAHFRVYVSDNAVKEALNREWLLMFPDEDDRPARHTSVGRLKEGVRIQIEITAVIE